MEFLTARTANLVRQRFAKLRVEGSPKRESKKPPESANQFQCQTHARCQTDSSPRKCTAQMSVSTWIHIMHSGRIPRLALISCAREPYAHQKAGRCSDAASSTILTPPGQSQQERHQHDNDNTTRTSLTTSMTATCSTNRNNKNGNSNKRTTTT